MRSLIPRVNQVTLVLVAEDNLVGMILVGAMVAPSEAARFRSGVAGPDTRGQR